MTFGSEVFQPVRLATFGSNEQALRQAIQDLLPNGKSALYDGVREGFSVIRGLEDETRINAVVVVADGGDDGSSITLDRLAREAEAACDAEGQAIPIITVAYGAEADEQALDRIARACPGEDLTATPGDVVEVFEGIGLLF